jgi:MoaA/NifB/PqqE/SkfB family radical SAM enzyme
MLDDLTGFHIEPTNICTLKCPRCPRTKFIETFPKIWKNKNLNLSHLKSFLDIDLTGKKFTLCGNNGDPIYYNDLLNLVSWIKSCSANVTIITNGSYQKQEWWESLCNVLSSDDTIIFSIDGTPENFTTYRVNANWDSILTGIKIATASKVKTKWKYIPFGFNEHDIDTTRDFSNNLGIDEFLVETSDRWDSIDDPLRPKTFTGIREQSILQWHKNSVDPQCKKLHNQHYISADGYYLPCCYVGDYRFYYKTNFYKNRNLYNISKTTLSKILTDLTEFYSTIEKDNHSYCTYNCPKL